MNMKYSDIQLNNLPDELLMIIFKKLTNVAILYSLYGIDKRLNQIVHDPIFTNHLTLLKCLDDDYYPLPDPMLDRFCLEILPEISNKIKWLHLESSSMERILLSTNYPHLQGLSLYDVEIETAKYIFTNETSLIHIYKNQILSFVIDVTKNEKKSLPKNLNELVFIHILTMFTNLQYFNFGPSSNAYQWLSFDISSPTVFSSNLLELHVCLNRFTDCLYLLDGRFNQLRILHVTVSIIYSSRAPIDNKEKLPNLKCFSLYCDMPTAVYDELIVMLLHRMFNLEKLGLYIEIFRKKTFVDGNVLTTDIINHMPRLKKFSFNIYSWFSLNNQIDLPSNEDIQQTFRNFKQSQVITSVNYFSIKEEGQCHVFSYPFTMKCYQKIGNNFPGGLFKCVREVSLYDECPFEHEFFLRIAQSFPLMEELKIVNKKPQNKKQFRWSKHGNKNLSIIKYLHLANLVLHRAHEDYVEQFLNDTRTCLPSDIHLFIDYRSMKKVTHNFKRAATRINCSKANYIYSDEFSRVPKHFEDYFLSTKAL